MTKKGAARHFFTLPKCALSKSSMPNASPLPLPSSPLPHLQGYLAHKKHPPRRNLQQPYDWGPTVALGGGEGFMSEVPLCRVARHLVLKAHRLLYHSTLGLRVIKKKKHLVLTLEKSSS